MALPNSRRMVTERNIGDYQVLSLIGAGSMGDVFLVRKRASHGFEKIFALKTIREAYQHDDVLRAMFLGEARLVAQLTTSHHRASRGFRRKRRQLVFGLWNTFQVFRLRVY
ncbi:MAG: hypothetical protein R3C68_01770 [Myxococcota bacterium]